MSAGPPLPGPENAPAPRKRRRLLRAAAVVLGLLVLGEAGLRILADRDSRFNIAIGAAREFDPVRKVRLKRSYESEGIRTNSKGFLGPEFEARKPAGGFRIVVLGDSCSFHPPERPYARVLEEELRLRHPGRTIDVINASVPGYDSGQARSWYETEIDGYDHDALVVFLGWNDMGQYHPDGLADKLRATGYLPEPSLLQKALINCYLLRSCLVLQGYRERGRPFVTDPMSPEDAARYGAFYPAHFEENVREILKRARGRGRPAFVLNFPGLLTPSPTEDEKGRMHFPRGMGRHLAKYLALKDAYLRALRKAGGEEKASFVDLEALFDTAESRRVFTDTVHFDVRGADRVGRALADVLSPLIR